MALQYTRQGKSKDGDDQSTHVNVYNQMFPPIGMGGLFGTSSTEPRPTSPYPTRPSSIASGVAPHPQLQIPYHQPPSVVIPSSAPRLAPGSGLDDDLPPPLQAPLGSDGRPLPPVYPEGHYPSGYSHGPGVVYPPPRTSSPPSPPHSEEVSEDPPPRPAPSPPHSPVPSSGGVYPSAPHSEEASEDPPRPAPFPPSPPHSAVPSSGGVYPSSPHSGLPLSSDPGISFPDAPGSPPHPHDPLHDFNLHEPLRPDYASPPVYPSSQPDPQPSMWRRGVDAFQRWFTGGPQPDPQPQPGYAFPDDYAAASRPMPHSSPPSSHDLSEVSSGPPLPDFDPIPPSEHQDFADLQHAASRPFNARSRLHRAWDSASQWAHQVFHL